MNMISLHRAVKQQSNCGGQCLVKCGDVQKSIHRRKHKKENPLAKNAARQTGVLVV